MGTQTNPRPSATVPLITLATATLITAATLLPLTRAPAATPASPASSQPAAPARTQALPLDPRQLLLPGTQPRNLQHPLVGPADCRGCHAGQRALTGQPEETEVQVGWMGSLMAHSGRDPVFEAALDIANADAPGSGEYCLRCHMPEGWLAGRSRVADGSAMTAADREGVHCSVCHRLVDPLGEGDGPGVDAGIRAALTQTVRTVGSARFVFDPLDRRRGPRDLGAEGIVTANPHLTAEGTVASPFHRRAELCGTCHDIDNPLYAWDAFAGAYRPRAAPGPPGADERLFPIERTYSEWRASAFAQEGGVPDSPFAPEGQSVSSCQDCHMARVRGAAGSYFGEAPLRDDLAMHDLTGASTWVQKAILAHPTYGPPLRADPLIARAMVSGTLRAAAMLRRAARLDLRRDGAAGLAVTVVNQSGHKLPTGYVEGRRMWLEVEGFDAAGRRVFHSGRYDAATARLEQDPAVDPQLHRWEAHQDLTAEAAAASGVAAGSGFHFALNNQIVQDHRIPPRGYAFAAFDAAGAAPHTDGRPDPTRYRDGQHWDPAAYRLPPGVVSGTVRLWHQPATAEYIAFLRDAGPFRGRPDSRGDLLYRLWEETGKAAPVEMARVDFSGWRVWLPRVGW